jgi:hypothetical protein
MGLDFMVAWLSKTSKAGWCSLLAVEVFEESKIVIVAAWGHHNMVVAEN